MNRNDDDAPRRAVVRAILSTLTPSHVEAIAMWLRSLSVQFAAMMAPQCDRTLREAMLRTNGLVTDHVTECLGDHTPALEALAGVWFSCSPWRIVATFSGATEDEDGVPEDGERETRLALEDLAHARGAAHGGMSPAAFALAARLARFAAAYDNNTFRGYVNDLVASGDESLFALFASGVLSIVGPVANDANLRPEDCTRKDYVEMRDAARLAADMLDLYLSASVHPQTETNAEVTS